MSTDFEAVFLSAEDPMLLILEDRIEEVNPAFCSISGFKKEEVLGKPFLRFIVDRPKVAEAYLRRIRGSSTPAAYKTEVAARNGVYTVTICGTRVEIDGKVGVFVILKR